MVAIWAAVILAATVGLSPGLVVETGSPDALCPELSSTRAAVEARLGVVGVQGRAGWTARYTMWHVPDQDSDFVRLEVIDPAGARRLVRDLPLAGESCSTMASVIALVLDRYFRDLLGSGTAAPSSPTIGASAAPAKRDLSGPRFVLALAGGAVMLPASPGMLVTLAVEARSARLALQTGWAAYSPTQSLGAGAAELTTSIPVRLGLGWTRFFGRVGVHGGAELFSAYERARATGIAMPGDNSRLALGAGVAAGVAARLGRGLRLTADIAVDRVLGGGRLTIDNVEVLKLPWRAVAAIGIAYAIGTEGS